MENTDRILDSCLRCYTLNGLNYDFLRLLVCIEFCIVHNLIDVTCSIKLCLIFQAFNQSFLCFFSTKSREFFKLCLLLFLHFLKFLLLHRQQLLLIINPNLFLINIHLATTKFFLTLIQCDFTLL